MGNQCIKSKGLRSVNSDISTSLSSYHSACEDDPDLQKFDSSLQARTTKALKSITINKDNKSLSLDSLRDVTSFFLDMNQEVANVILASEKDIWKDAGLLDLVKEYLESSIHTMKFCSSLEECLDRARNTQSIILVALKKFQRESQQNKAAGPATSLFSETLEQLKSLKAAGDPFSAKFFSSFHSVYLQQHALLSKLMLKKSDLDKKFNTLKALRRVSNIIFVSVFVCTILCTIVAAVVTLPPVVTALAAAASAAQGTVGTWINSIWDKYENELKSEREMLTTMSASNLVVIQDLQHIWVLVQKLQITMEGLLQSADFAIRESTDVVMSAMEEIKKDVNGLTENIEALSQHANKCNQDIAKARTAILQKIINQSTS